MFGTLTATSMVEFGGAGGIAGVNMPVDGTGVSKEAGYWVAQSLGLTGGMEDCLASCRDLMPVGGAGSGVSSGPEKTTNSGWKGTIGRGIQGVGVGFGVVGLLSIGAAVFLAPTPAAAIPLILGIVSLGVGYTIYNIGSSIIPPDEEGRDKDGASGGGSASLGGLVAYMACVNRCKYGGDGPFGDSGGAPGPGGPQSPFPAGPSV